MKRLPALLTCMALSTGLALGLQTPPKASAQAALRLDDLTTRTVVADGSQVVTLTGAGFDESSSVLLGHERLVPERHTSSSLTVRIPRLAPGTRPVVVEGAGQRTTSRRGTALTLREPSGVVSAGTAGTTRTGARVRAAAVTTIEDANLAACLSDALGLPEGSAPGAAQVAGITELNCQNRQISSLQGLQQATGLRSLEVSGNTIASLEPLRPLSGLQRLWAADNAISDLSPLGGKPALTLLDVSSNRVAALDPLATDTGLRELVFDDNLVTSLAPLAGLGSLATIHASFNKVSSLSPLSGLPLRELHVWDNRITSLAPLSGRTGLQHLDVSYNGVGSLAPLARLTAMQRLNLEGNAVGDLAPLSTMSSLTELNANANRLRSVAPLARLPKLYWIFLRDNALLDLSPLKSSRAPAVEAQGQRITLPVSFSTATVTKVVDRTGAAPSITGARRDASGLVWPGIGARTATFTTGDETFTGTITQTVRTAERFGDANDDGLADLFTVSGSAMSYRAGRGFALGAPVAVSGDWSTTTALAPMHDNTGDRMSDLMSRDKAGSLWMHPVTGPARLGTKRLIGRNWNGMTIIAPAGRLAGGGTQFVIARRSDGGLFRYTITPSGLTGVTQIGWRWNGMRQVIGVGDWTADGREDLMGLRQDGTLWLYEGTARGTLKAGREVGHGWSGFTLAVAPGDLSGDGTVDLVGLRGDGKLFGYPNVRSSWGAAREMASGMGTVRLMA